MQFFPKIVIWGGGGEDGEPEFQRTPKDPIRFSSTAASPAQHWAKKGKAHETGKWMARPWLNSVGGTCTLFAKGLDMIHINATFKS